MERVSDDWLNHTIKNGVDRTIGDYYKVLYALEELQVRRKGEKDGAGATQEKPVLPIPCTKGFENWTVKQWFAKINEELDELKAEALSAFYSLEVIPHDRPDLKNSEHDRMPTIAEEAADTITAITSMLEAMGIDERQRQAAQVRVNEHNRERNRL